MKLLKTLRNHWKKSLFAFCTLSYGSYYLLNRKRTSELFQAYCYEALKHSLEKVHPEKKIQRVTVFLNPKANDESSKFNYDKNVAPLLNLSGLDVLLIRFDKNTEANEYMKQIDLTETDCIVIAGGNATLNECLSGLMSRPDSNLILQKLPIGIIPLGATNSFANKWFMKLGLDQTDETNLRLQADSAMSIIKGRTVPADLMKITINQTSEASSSQELPEADNENNKKGCAYKLLKENSFYAVSNVSAGFVTETDAYINSYKYFWKLKHHMNRYFMARHLRRQPVKFNLTYKLKCNGCSKCLNESELSEKLRSLITKKETTKSIQLSEPNGSNSFIQILFRKFFSFGKFTLKDTPEQLENRLKEKKIYETLIEKSKLTNEKCNKIFTANLVQSELIANINEPEQETNTESRGIQTVVVRDPEFNQKKMFLAEKKFLNEFEIVKENLNEKNIKFNNPESNLDNVFCIELDGETYKLDNFPATNLKIRVEHLEKRFNLLVHDEEMSKNIQPSFWSHVYNTFRSEVKNDLNNEMPLIKPFENLYLKYWNYNK